jgi:hypothetical protein
MLKVLIHTLRLTVLILLLIAPFSVAQESGNPFVRLATYWDSPGDVKAISADDRWMVITDYTAEITRLVEIATGDILTEQPRDYIYFSPDGRYASVYDVASGNTQIIDLARKAVTYEAQTGIILIRFSADSKRGQVPFHDDEQNSYHSQVIELETGEVLLDVPGWSERLSPDGQYIAITDPVTQTVTVYEVDSGEMVLEWSVIEQGDQQARASGIFSPDSKLLVIYQSHNFTGYVFEVGTWERLYEIVGYPGFNADSRYILSNRHARYSHVFLYEAATGTLLDEVDGDMYFSTDGTLLFRRQGAFDGDSVGTIQVIELPTLRPLIEISGEGYDTLSVGPLANNTMLRVYKQIFDIKTRPITEFIDLNTGETVKVFDGYADLIDADRNLLHVGGISWLGQPGGKLMNWETGEVYIWEGGIQLSSTGKYIITSNGLLVDIYGAPEDRLDTMPPPRPDSGIGTMEAGDIVLYPVPDAANPLIENTLNRLTFYVLGQTVGGEWLYGTGMLNERREGWLKADHLTMVKPWDSVPVLDTADPMGNLYEISATKP